MTQDSLSVIKFYVLNVSKNYVIEKKTASFSPLLRVKCKVTPKQAYVALRCPGG
jgi:hypothetical protein